ncbi:MAG: DNA-binding protein [Acidobacteriota bacterium]
MNRKVIVATAVVGWLLCGLGAWAQWGGGMGGRGGRGGPRLMYDTDTVQTVTGTVQTIEKRQFRDRSFVVLELKTAEGTLLVHLGPSAYLDQQTVKLTPGDEVSIKGSKMAMQGREMMVAAQVTKGGAVLKLRDPATGVPLWPRQGPPR